MKSLEVPRCPSCGANIYEGQTKCEYCKSYIVTKEEKPASRPRSNCGGSCMAGCTMCCSDGCTSVCTGTAHSRAFADFNVVSIDSATLTDLQTGAQIMLFSTEDLK